MWCGVVRARSRKKEALVRPCGSFFGQLHMAQPKCRSCRSAVCVLAVPLSRRNPISNPRDRCCPFAGTHATRLFLGSRATYDKPQSSKRINKPWRPICLGSTSGDRAAEGAAFRSMEGVEGRNSGAFGQLVGGGVWADGPQQPGPASVARLSSSLCPDRASINEEGAPTAQRRS